MGVAIGDYDNDGDRISSWETSESLALSQQRDGTLLDVAEKSGGTQGLEYGATWAITTVRAARSICSRYAEIDLANLPPSPAAAAKPGGVGQNFCQFSWRAGDVWSTRLRERATRCITKGQMASSKT